MTIAMPKRKTGVTVTSIPTMKRSVPLFLPMGLDEIFHEESRFRTKKEEGGEDKRRGDTSKCHFGKGQEIGAA